MHSEFVIKPQHDLPTQSSKTYHSIPIIANTPLGLYQITDAMLLHGIIRAIVVVILRNPMTTQLGFPNLARQPIGPAGMMGYLAFTLGIPTQHWTNNNKARPRFGINPMLESTMHEH